MASSGPVPESPLEAALRLANGAVEKGLIGGYAVAGAFAFIYYGEPFETKDLDLLMRLSLTPGGLVDVAPVRKLDDVLARHGLVEAWRRLRPAP